MNVFFNLFVVAFAIWVVWFIWDKIVYLWKGDPSVPLWLNMVAAVVAAGLVIACGCLAVLALLKAFP